MSGSVKACSIMLHFFGVKHLSQICYMLQTVFEISRGKLIISEVDNFEVLIILGVWADNLLIIYGGVDLIISQVDNY